MKSTPSAKIYRPTPRNLALLGRVLAQGGLVAAPTETVYGLAADALNTKACRAIFKAKGRPTNDPLIVHVATVEQADTVAVLNEAARKVAKLFWPGPLTLVLPKRANVPDIVTSGLSSVAVRLPSHQLFRELIRLSGCPLAAPSANPFGYVSPTSAAHVFDGLGKRIGYILDGGSAKIGVESTILDLRDPKHPVLLRPGAVSREALARVLGRKITIHSRSTPASTAAVAPGLLERHYSPRTPLTLVKKLTPALIKKTGANEALLFMQKPAPVNANTFWLCEAPNAFDQAAHTLFDRLRSLDNGAWTHIHAELAQGTDALALAVNDRLQRAAAKR